MPPKKTKVVIDANEDEENVEEMIRKIKRRLKVTKDPKMIAKLTRLVQKLHQQGDKVYPKKKVAFSDKELPSSARQAERMLAVNPIVGVRQPQSRGQDLTKTIGLKPQDRTDAWRNYNQGGPINAARPFAAIGHQQNRPFASAQQQTTSTPNQHQPKVLTETEKELQRLRREDEIRLLKIRLGEAARPAKVVPPAIKPEPKAKPVVKAKPTPPTKQTPKKPSSRSESEDIDAQIAKAEAKSSGHKVDLKTPTSSKKSSSGVGEIDLGTPTPEQSSSGESLPSPTEAKALQGKQTRPKPIGKVIADAQMVVKKIANKPDEVNPRLEPQIDKAISEVKSSLSTSTKSSDLLEGFLE